MIGLRDKRIIIIGANGCLGQALAERLVAENCRLLLVDKDIIKSAEQVTSDGCLTMVADVRDAAQVSKVMAYAEEKLGGIDGLVNMAAILMPEDAALETPLAAFEASLATNLTGTFLTCQAALPYLLKGQHSAIVNVSSVVAHAASATAQLAYTSAKGGVEALTREIAMAYARQGIRANCVAPGPVLSARNQHYFDDDEKWQARRQHIPMGRLGKPHEIAGTIAFLLSDDAGYITGTSILADGGIANAYVIKDENGDATPNG